MFRRRPPRSCSGLDSQQLPACASRWARSTLRGARGGRRRHRPPRGGAAHGRRPGGRARSNSVIPTSAVDCCHAQPGLLRAAGARHGQMSLPLQPRDRLRTAVPKSLSLSAGSDNGNRRQHGYCFRRERADVACPLGDHPFLGRPSTVRIAPAHRKLHRTGLTGSGCSPPGWTVSSETSSSWRSVPTPIRVSATGCPIRWTPSRECRSASRYLPVRSRCLHPGQQQGRRWPSSSSSWVRRMRRSRVVSCLASSTQQMNSLRAKGVMSFQASSAVVFAISASRRSAGSGCTTPPGTRWLLTGQR